MNARTNAPPTGAIQEASLWRPGLGKVPPVPVKTDAGLNELRSRSGQLSQRHRTLLLWVDGRRNAAELLALAQPAGVPAQCLDDLLALGFVAWAERAMPAGPPLPSPSLPPSSPPRAARPSEPELADDLPASEALGADSTLTASLWQSLGSDSALPWEALSDAREEPDPAVMQARQWLIDAVRAEAPIAGTLTLRRLKRAQTRLDVLALLDEVSARIERPQRALAVQHLLERVRDRLR
ncbi:MAG: hypothetical protein RJA98_3097 [Pseudomonadota bacterium]|jgi:hypothetical protein